MPTCPRPAEKYFEKGLDKREIFLYYPVNKFTPLPNVLNQKSKILCFTSRELPVGARQL